VGDSSGHIPLRTGHIGAQAWDPPVHIADIRSVETKGQPAHTHTPGRQSPLLSAEDTWDGGHDFNLFWLRLS